MILLILLIIILGLLLNLMNKKRNLDYKCFLLTLKDSTRRRQNFLNHFSKDIPLEIIYGVDTKKVENAKKYEKLIDPEYYKEAIKLHYDKEEKRPDITYFDLGAIGCYMGHMDFYDRCFEQNLKYAVIFEDNVIITDPQLYNEIQYVIDDMGNDFEICFFHCLSRLPSGEIVKNLEKVNWISSTKCYLINVKNMRKYHKYFMPMDNHVDMKHEDLIAKGARIFYKDLRNYMYIDRTKRSTIGHTDWKKKKYFSKIYPQTKTDELIYGY